MFVVSVEFTIKPGHEDAFRGAVSAQARYSLEREAECHQFDVGVAPDQPGRFFLYEVYSDAAAFEVHLQTQHFAAFGAKVQDWVVDKQVATWERLERQRA